MKTGGSSPRMGAWPILWKGPVLSSTTEGNRKPFIDRAMTESSDDEESRLGLRLLLKRSLEAAEKNMVEARELRRLYSLGDGGDWTWSMAGVMIG
jgi:hypothetical protein